MALDPKPTITPPPTPLPTRGEDPVVFSNNINALVAWYPDLTTNLSDGIDWIDLAFTATETEALAAAASASDASTSETNAAASEAAALGYRNESETFKDSAETAAAAAQAAAGLPSLAGNAGYSLTVNDAENGVAWELVGSSPGEIQIRTSQVEAKWLPMDGSMYLQSSYPLLASIYPQWSYDLATNNTVPTVNDDVRAIAASPDNTRIAIAGNFTTSPAGFQVIETSGFTRIATTWTAPVGDAETLDYSNNGSWLAVGSAGSAGDNGLFVLDTSDYSTVLLGPSGFSTVSLARFSPDNSWLALRLGSDIEIYDTSTWTLETTISPGIPINFAWSPDSSKLVVGFFSAGVLEFYNAGTWTIFDDTSVTLAAGCSSEDGGMSWVGNTLAIAHGNNSPWVTFVDTDALEIVKIGTEFGVTSRVGSVSISDDSAFFALSNVSDVYNLIDYTVVSGVFAFSSFFTVKFSPDSQFLMCGNLNAPHYSVIDAKSPTEITIPTIASPAIGTIYKVRSEV